MQLPLQVVLVHERLELLRAQVRRRIVVAAQGRPQLGGALQPRRQQHGQPERVRREAVHGADRVASHGAQDAPGGRVVEEHHARVATLHHELAAGAEERHALDGANVAVAPVALRERAAAAVARARRRRRRQRGSRAAAAAGQGVPPVAGGRPFGVEARGRQQRVGRGRLAGGGLRGCPAQQRVAAVLLGRQRAQLERQSDRGAQPRVAPCRIGRPARVDGGKGGGGGLQRRRRRRVGVRVHQVRVLIVERRDERAAAPVPSRASDAHVLVESVGGGRRWLLRGGAAAAARVATAAVAPRARVVARGGRHRVRHVAQVKQPHDVVAPGQQQLRRRGGSELERVQRVVVEGELGALERKAEDGRRGRAQVKQHDAAVLAARRKHVRLDGGGGELVRGARVAVQPPRADAPALLQRVHPHLPVERAARDDAARAHGAIAEQLGAEHVGGVQRVPPEIRDGRVGPVAVRARERDGAVVAARQEPLPVGAPRGSVDAAVVQRHGRRDAQAAQPRGRRRGAALKVLPPRRRRRALLA